jgi:geranylgeranyl pyrophosphate synthase
VLFASEQFPELNTLILRHFSHPGDIPRAVELVRMSDGIARARVLAQEHCDAATALVMRLPHSLHRDALVALPAKILSRDR